MIFRRLAHHPRCCCLSRSGGADSLCLGAVSAPRALVRDPFRRSLPMRHVAVRALCGFTLLVLIAAATAAPGATATGTGIAWQPCPVTALPARECGELTVPLDYNQPDG